jgi:hypothetical protein
MNRILSLDLARGFTVLFIPAIHTGMLYSQQSVHHTWLGQFLIAIAEGPGGQLLMLLMGVSFTLKTQHSTRQVFIKAVGLLAAGYALNILKFVVPYSVGALPGEVLGELEVVGEETALWQLTGMGDILHFAGLTLPVLHRGYKCKQYQWWALGAALGIMVASPLLWDVHSNIPVLDYVCGLATGQPPRVFFPLFPWLVYPLAGMFIGHYFRQNQSKTAQRCGVIGALLVIAGIADQYYFPAANTAGFYRTPVAATAWHLGIVLLALCLWHLAATYIKQNAFFRLLIYSSKNITLIYIIQWVMICWMLPLVGFRKLDVTLSAFVMVIMTLNTFLLTYCLQLIKKSYEKR